jgi:hypothetical protein
VQQVENQAEVFVEPVVDGVKDFRVRGRLFGLQHQVGAAETFHAN